MRKEEKKKKKTQLILFDRFVSCVKLLLSYKPDLTIKDKGDMTASDCAGFGVST